MSQVIYSIRGRYKPYLIWIKRVWENEIVWYIFFEIFYMRRPQCRPADIAEFSLFYSCLSLAELDGMDGGCAIVQKNACCITSALHCILRHSLIGN